LNLQNYMNDFVNGRFSDYSKIYSADSYNSVISSVLHVYMMI